MLVAACTQAVTSRSTVSMSVSRWSIQRFKLLFNDKITARGDSNEKRENQPKRHDYAMRTALATVCLEGLEPSQDAKSLAAKVAKGEMTGAGAVEAMKRNHAVSA